MFKIIAIIKSCFGVALIAGIYGMAWDVATRGKGYQENETWFYAGLLLMIVFAVLTSLTSLTVNNGKLKEEYASY